MATDPHPLSSPMPMGDAPGPGGQGGTPPSGAAPAKPPRRWWRWLVWPLATIALLLAVALGGLWWASGYPATLPWLLARVPGLQVQGVQGSLQQDPLQVAELRWTLPAQAGELLLRDLRLQGWSVRARPHSGAWAALQIRTLEIGLLQFKSGPPGAPAKAPTSLRLPIDLKIDQLQIGTVQINQLPAAHGLAARVALGAERGAQHQIDLSALRVDLGAPAAPGQRPQTAPSATQPPAAPQVHLLGQWRLGADSPLPLHATLGAAAQGALPWRAGLQLSGPLDRLNAQASVRGQAAQPGRAVPGLQAQATLQAWQAWPISALALSTQALDLQTLWPGLPHTRLSGQALVQTAGLGQAASADLRLDNTLPGAWSQGQLPVRQLRLLAKGTLGQPDRVSLEQLDLQLADAQGPAGRITGAGRWQAGDLALDLKLDGLQPARLHQSAATLVLSGPLAVQAQGLASPAQARWQVDTQLSGRLLDGTGQPVQLALKGAGGPDSLRLERVAALAGPARAQGQLNLSWQPQGWQAQASAELTSFDPRPWWRGAEGSAWRRGPHRLEGQAQLQLRSPQPWQSLTDSAWREALGSVSGQAKLTLANSLLAGVPLAGTMALGGSGQVASVQAEATLGGNRLVLSGTASAQTGAGTGRSTPGSTPWQLQVQAPDLATWQPLQALVRELAPGASAAWPTAGAVEGLVSLSGADRSLASEGRLQVRRLVTAQGRLDQADLTWRGGAALDSPLLLQLQAQGLVLGAQALDKLQADVAGTWREHRLQLQADSPVRPPAWTENLLGPTGTGTRLQLQATGQWPGDGQRRWALQGGTLSVGARDAQGGSRPWLAAQQLQGSAQLDGQGAPLNLQLSPGRLQLASTTALRWDELRWQRGGAGQADQFQVLAELESIDMARLMARLQPTMGWGGNLSLGGRIEVRAGTRFDADVVLQRGGGDLTLTDELGGVQALGLTDLRLVLGAHNGLWQFAQGLAGSSVGTLAGAQLIQAEPHQRWPTAKAPLSGILQARVANLGAWGTWVPPGWRLSGALNTQGQFGGTLGAPELRGSMQGQGLGLRNLIQGVSLSDGELAVVLEGETARIERLVFKGGEGLLTLTGGATLGAQPSASLKLVAERFKLLARIDRRIVVSGQTTLLLDRERLKLDGDVLINDGLVDMSQGDAPKLDSDVVVTRPAGKLPANSPGPVVSAEPVPLPLPLRQAQVALRVNLGDKLRLRGHGVDTLLRGDLLLTTPGGRPTVTGSVRTQDGKFAAYGQKLDISRGEVTFTGALDNPRIDVLALRPNLDVVVGVSVTGNASNPRVRLYSEPELADYDKLSWLVLGRSPDGLGNADTALLQRAAIALLSGNQASATDQLLNAVGLTDFSLRQSDGDTRDTIITLGKQLSRRWYVGYERSVHATTGTWQLVYRIAQRFTLRAQSGSENAVDLIWSWRW